MPFLDSKKVETVWRRDLFSIPPTIWSLCGKYHTLFVIATPAPYSADQLEYYAEVKSTNASAAIRKFVESHAVIGRESNERMCLDLEKESGLRRSDAAFIGQIGLIAVLALLLIKIAIDLVVV